MLIQLDNFLIRLPSTDASQWEIFGAKNVFFCAKLVLVLVLKLVPNVEILRRLFNQCKTRLQHDFQTSFNFGFKLVLNTFISRDKNVFFSTTFTKQLKVLLSLLSQYFHQIAQLSSFMYNLFTACSVYLYSYNWNLIILL